IAATAPPAASPYATAYIPPEKVAKPAAPVAAKVATPPPAAPKPAPAAAKPAALETAKGSPVDNEGELVTFLAHKPILLDDPESVWSVASGGVLIFTVAIENGEPSGTRTHFMGINPGQCFFGFDLKAYGFGSGFLAVAKQGTQVRKIPRTRLREIAADRARRAGVARIVDEWVNGLSVALIHDFPAKRADEMKLKTGERVELPQNSKASVAEGVAWIEMSSGAVMFDDMSTPIFSLRSALFPLTTSSWIQPLSDEFGHLIVTPVATADAVADGALWTGL